MGHEEIQSAVAEFVGDQYGNATCTETSAGSLQEVKDVYGGKWLTEIKSFTLPNNQCPDNIYQWSAAYDTWGFDSVDLADPFIMHRTTPDGQFNESSIIYPSGAAVSYTRDIMGRITAVNAPPSGGTSTPVASSIAYEPFGTYSGLTYGNGVAEARGFDQDYR